MSDCGIRKGQGFKEETKYRLNLKVLLGVPRQKQKKKDSKLFDHEKLMEVPTLANTHMVNTQW